METIYIETTILSDLVTWNCKHIANAHALRQLRKYNENQGYEFPQVCTPEEL